MRNFDIVSIDPIIDWFNLMPYDLHGTWDSTDPAIGPIAQGKEPLRYLQTHLANHLHLAHTNLTEINQSLDLLWRNNIDPGRGLP